MTKCYISLLLISYLTDATQNAQFPTNSNFNITIISNTKHKKKTNTYAIQEEFIVLKLCQKTKIMLFAILS